MSRTLAVVPARSGSQGVPDKNVREVGGKPLLAHQVENATEAALVDQTIVSTDNEGYADIARDYGAEVPFIRPADISTEDVPVIAAYKHALEYFSERGTDYEYVVGLQPTCPFTAPDEIDAAVEKIRGADADSVASVAKVTETHPHRAFTLDGDRLKPFEDVTVMEPDQRQDRPDVYGLTGAILVREAPLLSGWDGADLALGGTVRTVVQEGAAALDIDSPFDLQVARALAEYESGNGDHR